MFTQESLNVFFYLYSMLANADMNEFYAEHARPGGWNGIYQQEENIYVFEKFYD